MLSFKNSSNMRWLNWACGKLWHVNAWWHDTCYHLMCLSFLAKVLQQRRQHEEQNSRFVHVMSLIFNWSNLGLAIDMIIHGQGNMSQSSHENFWPHSPWPYNTDRGGMETDLCLENDKHVVTHPNRWIRWLVYRPWVCTGRNWDIPVSYSLFPRLKKIVVAAWNIGWIWLSSQHVHLEGVCF